MQASQDWKVIFHNFETSTKSLTFVYTCGYLLLTIYKVSNLWDTIQNILIFGLKLLNNHTECLQSAYAWLVLYKSLLLPLNASISSYFPLYLLWFILSLANVVTSHSKHFIPQVFTFYDCLKMYASSANFPLAGPLQLKPEHSCVHCCMGAF